MRGSLIGASLLATIVTLALAPAVASAGQIVFVRQAGSSWSETDLWVMNEDGSNQRMLLAQNQNLAAAITRHIPRASRTTRRVESTLENEIAVVLVGS